MGVVSHVRYRKGYLMRKLSRLTVGALLALGLLAGSASASGIWARFHSRDGRAVIIRERCIGAEDSAAHLKLLDYSSDRIVYGCYRKGF